MSDAPTSAIMPTYSRIDIDFERGEGSWLYDTAGKRWLDAVAGVAVCSLGHAHASFARAIGDQAARLVHTSNLYGVPLQKRLAEKLCKVTGMRNAFFCNSGAEANEAAIKLARMYGYKRGIERPVIIVMEGAFHGRTMGALSATHSARHQEGFAPLLDGFVRVPYDDVQAVEKAAAGGDVVAVLVEPVQGESGVHIPAPGYLMKLREVCDRHQLLLMLDEVQTGNGRTGTYFAFQHEEDLLPDVLSTAKGLGNGFPIGACLAAGPAAGILQPGNHATTFGGSPLACAAGLAVYEAIDKEGLLDNARRMGERLLAGLKNALEDDPHVRQVRGLGLMIGVEMERPCAEIAALARKQGVLVNVANGNVVRLVPPLVLKADEADLIVEAVSRAVAEFANG